MFTGRIMYYYVFVDQQGVSADDQLSKVWRLFESWEQRGWEYFHRSLLLSEYKL